jgi:probable F420-dependent oxidoreductase
MRRMPPTVGVFALGMHAAADPAAAEAVARRAEELGYDSLWAAEHVVLPSPRVPPSPMEPGEEILDPLVTLGFLAGCTRRVRLGTGVVVLPQRNPLILAKQLASVDVLSRGRLLFGAGAGYLEPELRALGVDPAGRGARTDEYLATVRSLWYDDEPAFHGDHVDLEGVDAHPRPVQRPVPVVIGGHSPRAHRRAVEQGDEWYGFSLGIRATTDQVAGLRDAAERYRASRGDRPPLRVNVTPGRTTVDRDTVSAYAGLGVHRLILRPPPGATLDELLAWLEDHRPEAIGAMPDPAA